MYIFFLFLLIAVVTGLFTFDPSKGSYKSNRLESCTDDTHLKTGTLVKKFGTTLAHIYNLVCDISTSGCSSFACCRDDPLQ